MTATIDFERAARTAERLREHARKPEHEPEDRAALIERARRALAPTMPRREAPPYPAAALGPLADVCATVAEHAQVDPAMAGQCLLGAASLLTQGLFNVETLAGPRPLSLFLKTLGDSGDGKSQAQSVALHAIREWQRRQAQQHAALLNEIASTPRGEPKSASPPAPYRVCRDATVEGLRRDLDAGVCSQGMFNDEAAAVLYGYGMSNDHKAKTAAVLSGLWDAGHLSVSRSIGGRVERYGRRLALHWLIQPAAAAATADDLLTCIGFWPRFLLAFPNELPPRVAKPFRAADHSAICDYWRRCEVLLDEPLPEDADAAPALPLAAPACALIGKAMEHFERAGRRGALKAIKPFALRAAEQACRVAGVLAAYAGHHEVAVDDAERALALVGYSIQSWLALAEDGQADQTSASALRLFEWLTDPKKCPERRAKLSRIVNAGPACVRSKCRRDDAIDALLAAKLIVLDRDAGEVGVAS